MSPTLQAFSHASHVSLDHSNITLTNKATTNNYHPVVESKGLIELSKHCAFGAFLNSVERPDPPRCSAKTRVRLLVEMKGWATGTTQASSAMWLTGSAGSGKTALCQTTAEELKKEGHVLGCHFFFRTSKDGKRSDGSCWVPNVVHQMIRVLPKTLRAVEKAIRSNDSVFQQTSDTVFEELVLTPLLKSFDPRFSLRNAFKEFFGIYKRRKAHIPRLVVIDGLDECESPEMQILILQTIADVIPKLPIPLRFLIASRPETHIRTTINQIFNNIPLHHINLDEDQDVRKELEAYYSNRFEQIRLYHPSLRGQEAYADWPSQDDINILVSKSSTQFIFASTVMNYISHPRNHPVKRLKVILGIEFAPQDDRPFSVLDTLYTIILLSVEEADRKLVLLILTFIYLAGKGEFPYLNLEPSPKCLEGFLGLDSGDVARLLDPLVSLLILPEAPRGMISMLHASFFDYLRDPVRSEGLTMSLGDAHEVISAKIFHDTADSGSAWMNGSVLNAPKLYSFLYHALHASTSQRLVLMLYGLQDDMACLHLYYCSRMMTAPDEFNGYREQVYDLLCAKLGKSKGTIKRQPRALPSLIYTTSKVRRHAAEIVVEHTLKGIGGDDLAALLTKIFSTLQKRSLTHTWILGDLSVRSCIPLIRHLMTQNPTGSMLTQEKLFDIVEDPALLVSPADTEEDFAEDVLVYLEELEQLSSDRFMAERIDTAMGRWREYTKGPST